MGKLFGKRDFLRLLGSAAVSAPTAAVVAAKTAKPAAIGVSEPAFARVTRTNTLRCGYGIWEPGFCRDPKTGELSGIFHDYIEAIGRHLNLKIEWTEELGWGDFPAALNAGRIDVMGFGAWPKASQAREVLFTEPTYYLPINAYVRAGDTRFDRKAERINAADVTISVMDAELSSELAQSRFPKARTFSIPQLSDASMLLLNVAYGKADITFTDAWHGEAFMEKNPGQIRAVPFDRPLRLYGHTIPVGKGEHSLVSLLNTATDEIVASGEFQAIVDAYEKVRGVLLMQAPQYK
jgi:ABC-type amino acid transport substrate-binding protein